jgi:hypothetical protein
MAGGIKPEFLHLHTPELMPVFRHGRAVFPNTFTGVEVGGSNIAPNRTYQ